MKLVLFTEKFESLCRGFFPFLKSFLGSIPKRLKYSTQLSFNFNVKSDEQTLVKKEDVRVIALNPRKDIYRRIINRYK